MLQAANSFANSSKQTAAADGYASLRCAKTPLPRKNLHTTRPSHRPHQQANPPAQPIHNDQIELDSLNPYPSHG